MSDWRDLVRTFNPRDERTYEPIDLNRLMVFVISELQAAGIPTTFEALTVAAFREFPARFALVGFPEYPDAARVNRALLQLRPKYRNWATGDVKRGFILNEGGRRVVLEVQTQLLSSPSTSAPARRASGPGRTKDLSADLVSVESSALYRSFVESGSIDPTRSDDFFAVLGAYPYAPRRAVRDRLEALRAAADHAGHTSTHAFLTELRKTYRHLLQDQRSGGESRA